MNCFATSKVKNILLILFGNSLYAFGIVAFILPNNIVAGGSTGLALTVEHYLNLPISTFVLVFNLIMFLLGGLILGKTFAFTTLVSTFFYPIVLGALQQIEVLSTLTKDPLLAVICGGILIGFGIGIVMHAGASTGGMDIPPLILKKKLGISVSISLYCFDFFILVLQMTYSNTEEIIYGLLMVLIYTSVIDRVLLSGTAQTQVQIISKKTEEINEYILNSLDRGTTLLYGETGYLHQQQPLVLTVISNRELVQLKQNIKKIDPSAFMIISHVNEVKGSGFSHNKEHLPK